MWPGQSRTPDHPWMARAIRGWPGSATGPEQVSCRQNGASPSLPSLTHRREDSEKKRKDIYIHTRERRGRGGILGAGPVHPPLLNFSSLVFPSSLFPSIRGARLTILPALVSRKKVRAAGVALSSWKGALTEGARGRFQPHAFPIAMWGWFWVRGRLVALPLVAESLC